MITPKFVMQADGSDLRRTLTLVLRDNDATNAIEEAKQIAIGLLDAGYNSFAIFEAGEIDVEIVRFRAERGEPLVTMTLAGSVEISANAASS
jgi:hypothetical protein